MTMNFYELIHKYGKGKGEDTMWKSVRILSEMMDELKESHPEKYWKMLKDTYASMCGPHFNEDFGMWQIEQMYFKDKNGNIHHAPNWTKEQYRQAYEAHKIRLGDYTCWDFAVTIEMLYTDNACLLRSWFPSASEEEIKNKAIDLAIAYLDDIDDDEGGKVWHRFNG